MVSKNYDVVKPRKIIVILKKTDEVSRNNLLFSTMAPRPKMSVAFVLYHVLPVFNLKFSQVFSDFINSAIPETLPVTRTFQVNSLCSAIVVRPFDMADPAKSARVYFAHYIWLPKSHLCKYRFQDLFSNISLCHKEFCFFF